MKIALATNNNNKLREMRAILQDCFDEFLSMQDLGLDIEIEETGDTLVENALIKARTVCQLTGMIALADDTGLSVDALDGAPGIYTARFAGEEHNDDANIEKLLSLLKDVPDEKRTAHFSTVIAVCFPNGQELIAEGRVDGKIATEKRGDSGFGYDPVFYSFELNKCFAEGTLEDKNSVSHRSRALHAMLEKLQSLKVKA